MRPERVTARRREIGDQIHAARLYANLSQEEVALRASITLGPSTGSSRGHAAARIDTLIRISDAIGVPLADLVRE
ncbi:helix-turn-helix domain-containing protein [Streptomyces sp. NPDC056921]|uniref:helix-turn-helix domain-containing protein n=1 Tax=Streptomyces sp. NPDC056921 TaxID=3345966 RepID=UPI0036402BD4